MENIKKEVEKLGGSIINGVVAFEDNRTIRLFPHWEIGKSGWDIEVIKPDNRFGENNPAYVSYGSSSYDLPKMKRYAEVLLIAVELAESLNKGE